MKMNGNYEKLVDVPPLQTPTYMLLLLSYSAGLPKRQLHEIKCDIEIIIWLLNGL